MEIVADANSQVAANSALPYVLAVASFFFVILYLVFAPDTVISGSIMYAFFGNWLSLLVVSGLLFGILYLSVPQIAVDHDLTISNFTPHDTGVWISGVFAFLAFLLMVGRLRAAKRRLKRRGGLE